MPRQEPGNASAAMSGNAPSQVPEQATQVDHANSDRDRHHDDYDTDDEDGDADSSSSDYSSVSGDSPALIRIYGHTYHGSGRRLFPNDAVEDRRLRLQHELYQLCLDGRLHHVKLPIERLETRGRGVGEGDDTPDHYDPTTSPRFQILEVGAGNGAWAVDVARRYPNADVLGIDIGSTLLPKDVPPNLTFEIADAAEPWPPRLYDFIHVRNVVGGGIDDWEGLMAEVISHLKPGGALEFSEIRPQFHRVDTGAANRAPDDDGSISEAIDEYQRCIAKFTKEQGVDYDPVPRVMAYLEHAPIEDLRERVDWLHVSNPGNDPLVRRKEEIIRDMVEVGRSSHVDGLLMHGD